MEAPNSSFMRVLASSRSAALLTTVIAAGIFVMPKDMTANADSRFMLTGAFFAACTAAGIASARAYRRWRDQRLFQRFGPAGSNVIDILSFLRHERLLARTSYTTSFLVGSAAFSLYVLSAWPQATVLLLPYQSGLGTAAIISCLGFPLLALRNRRHAVNAWYLRRYLREALDHLQFRPRPFWATWRWNRKTRPVTPDRKDGFRVGDFTFRLADLVTNVLILGKIGSGKTICVLNNLLEGTIAAFKKPGEELSALVLDAKGDFKDKLRTLCERYDRAGDLYELNPAVWENEAGTSRSIAINPLDNDDDALEVATRLIAVLRLLGLEVGKEGSFFLDSAKTFLRHAITLVREAKLTEAPSIIDVYRLSQEPEDTTPLYHKLIEAIAQRYPADIPQFIRDAVAYFENEWGPMSEGQKSGVQGSITQLLDEFQVYPFNEIFTRKSTLSMADIIDQGKILLVVMPSSDYERMSRVVSTMIKLEFFRQVLLRPRKVRPSLFLADEAQVFHLSGQNKGDSDFFERSRESNHINVIATQNLEAFYKRVPNRSDIKNFLGNIGIKIFLRNEDSESNKWASELFGSRTDIVVTINEQAASDTGWFRRRHTSYGRSSRTVPRVPPESFVNLAVPVRNDPKKHCADSVMHVGSREQVELVRLTWPVNPLR